MDAIDKIDSDENEFAGKMQDMMFKLFAANRDIDFIMEVSERAFEIKDDEDVSKEVLTDVAIAEEENFDGDNDAMPELPELVDRSIAPNRVAERRVRQRRVPEHMQS